ncbi:SNF1 protein kinase-like protein [Elsinoe australis]|uniref:SNF1 protein kinase-like protein n=1 Tax=Elsinoe australis TaxID=40998 RepID=A0A4U7B918_9PEZI|nr:SNF1 protein kinase-like protein [Elsinoe australis]
MGNSPSTSQKQAPAGHSKSNDVPQRREPKRRESVHALPTSKATPAPPSASLSTAVTVPTASSPTQARDIRPSHSRQRSATIATPHLKPQDQLEKVMGNDTSKPKRATSRSSSLRTPPPPPPELQTTSPAEKAAGTPVDDSEPVFDPSPLDPTAPPSEAYNLPIATYNRPPRLPLPIDEENLAPGSPILSPVDEKADQLPPVDGLDNEADYGINRRTSVVSSNQDEEDDGEEFAAIDPNAPKTNYVIEWKSPKPGERVYVTGTFVNWERKYRLHANGPSKTPGALSTTIQLPAGTHHIKFLVNNDMQTSQDMPTTVDYGNILVNYIKINQDDLPQPVAVPAAPSKPMDIRTKQATEAASPVKVSSPATKAVGTSSPSQTPARASPRSAKTPPVRKSAPKQYTNEIPQYLIDLDTWPPPTDSPDSSPDTSSTNSTYQRAMAAAQAQPAPPSLPLFLNKSILNAATPLKDDASVLVLPNHTVLNHLATTNIKQGVLATSATTRYKTRFLTTIMYKPRSDED